jgi:hypothetical protein
MTIQKTIESLATEFAKNVLTALRGASLSELTETSSPPSSTDGGGSRPDRMRIKRRDGSVVYVGRDVLALTGLLSRQPGLRAEQIRAQLRWDKRTVTKAISKALNEKRVAKKGERRATKYYLA